MAHKVKRAKAYRGLVKRKVVCKMAGCEEQCEEPYSARSKICRYQMKVMEVDVDGVPSRFCHKCTKFQPVADFAKANHTRGSSRIALLVRPKHSSTKRLECLLTGL